MVQKDGKGKRIGIKINKSDDILMDVWGMKIIINFDIKIGDVKLQHPNSGSYLQFCVLYACSYLDIPFCPAQLKSRRKSRWSRTWNWNKFNSWRSLKSRLPQRPHSLDRGGGWQTDEPVWEKWVNLEIGGPIYGFADTQNVLQPLPSFNCSDQTALDCLRWPANSSGCGWVGIGMGKACSSSPRYFFQICRKDF